MSGDFDHMIDLFFREGRELVEMLGLSLVELDGDDAAAVHEAFRAVHSLKGMCATMGYDRLVALTHHAEDLLDAVRSGTLAASPQVVTALLATADQVGAALDELERSGQEPGESSFAPAARALAVAAGDADGTASPIGDPERQQQQSEVLSAATLVEQRIEQAQREGAQIVCVDVTLDASSLMPAARAYASLLVLGDLGEVVASEPSLSQLESADMEGNTVRAWLATVESVDAVVAAGQGCPEVVNCVATVVDGKARRDAALPSSDSMTVTAAGAGGASSRNPALRSASRGTSLGASRSTTVRVDASRVDALMRSVAELLVQRARVEAVARVSGNHDLQEAVEALGRAAQQMQTLVMDVRMVSIETLFRRLPRVVRDLEQALGKQVTLRLSGTDTELDRTVIDLLVDPLVHLVRNAVDHGIEAPEERLRKGKPATGHLTISASAAGGVVTLRIRDDGAGIRPDAVRERAVQRGLVTRAAADEMSDERALQLCFLPGFSTRDEVSDLSGRGVGLDVVLASVRQLGGEVTVDSSDEGTLMTIRLPLTLAIVPVLLVRAGEGVYGLPTSRVRATFDAALERCHTIGGRDVMLYGDEAVPVERLTALLGGIEPCADRASGHLVLIEGADGLTVLRVDEVLMQNDVVTRPLPAAVAASPLLSAGAMLGDGSIAFLLDTEGIVDRARKETMVVHGHVA